MPVSQPLPGTTGVAQACPLHGSNDTMTVNALGIVLKTACCFQLTLTTASHKGAAPPSHFIMRKLRHGERGTWPRVTPLRNDCAEIRSQAA